MLVCYSLNLQAPKPHRSLGLKRGQIPFSHKRVKILLGTRKVLAQIFLVIAAAIFFECMVAKLRTCIIPIRVTLAIPKAMFLLTLYMTIAYSSLAKGLASRD